MDGFWLWLFWSALIESLSYCRFALRARAVNNRIAKRLTRAIKSPDAVDIWLSVTIPALSVGLAGKVWTSIVPLCEFGAPIAEHKTLGARARAILFELHFS